MAQTTKWVVPKIENSIVRHPITNAPIPARGCLVSWSGGEGIYWRRRVMDGSVNVFDSDPSTATKTKSTVSTKISVDASTEETA